MNAMTVLGCWLCATVLDGLAAQSSAVLPAWQPRIEALIRQLGDSSFAKREAATKALLAEDEKIVPLLDQARKRADLELQRRISQALNDPAVKSYFAWPITSPTLRAKVISEGKRIESR